MTKPMIAGTMIVAVLALAACGNGSSGSDGAKASAGGSTASSTTTSRPASTSEGECGSDEGKTGFVRAFCDGPATVSFDIGGTKGKIEGGECAESGGYFTVNAGTVTGPGWVGAPPDYAGFLLPTASGPFTSDNVTASITTGGSTLILTDATGTHDADGATFTAVTMEDGAKATVTVTC